MFTAIRSKTKATGKTATRFAREKGGSVMMMSGLMFPVLLMLAGGATDIGRAYAIQGKAQRTMDAAVLSMARSSLTDAEIEEKGAEFLEGWFATRDMANSLENVTLNSRKNGGDPGQPSELTVTGTLRVKTFFLNIFGQNELDIGLSSSTLKPNPLPYEIALVLDVSGSMKENLNGGTRLDRLKEATATLLDELERQSANRDAPTISVVPYSTSVNLGGLGSGLLEASSVGGDAIPGGDVWAAERFRGTTGDAYDLGDEAPSSSAIPFVTADEIGSASPTVRLEAPSDDPAVYRAAVEGLEAEGWTAAHLGMIWGVYALSPAWSSVWDTDPRPYDEAQKAIVLLTDGEFNTTHNIGARSNDDGEESNAYFQSACKLAKEKDIAIYAVALSLDAASEQRLLSCAAGSGGKMFSANSADTLTEAFEEIARELGGLRLSS